MQPKKFQGVPGTKMHVVGTVEVKHQVADYMLVASRTCLRLFILLVTSNQFIAGDRLLRYCIIKGKPISEVKEFELEEPKCMYSRLYATTLQDRDRIFCAVPFKSKQLHMLETRRGVSIVFICLCSLKCHHLFQDMRAKLIGRISTGHQMGKILLFRHEDRILSYAYDGLVNIYKPRTHHLLLRGVIMPHHRKKGGILKAFMCPLQKYVVTLGRDNNIVCTSLTDAKVDSEKEERLKELLNSEKYAIMFGRPTLTFTLKGRTVRNIKL